MVLETKTMTIISCAFFLPDFSTLVKIFQWDIRLTKMENLILSQLGNTTHFPSEGYPFISPPQISTASSPTRTQRRPWHKSSRSRSGEDPRRCFQWRQP